jgi:hypothetical protein
MNAKPPALHPTLNPKSSSDFLLPELKDLLVYVSLGHLRFSVIYFHR